MMSKQLRAKANRKLTDFWQRGQPDLSSSLAPSSQPTRLTASTTPGPHIHSGRVPTDTRKTALEHNVFSIDSNGHVSITSDSTSIHSVTYISSDSHHTSPSSSSSPSPRTGPRCRLRGTSQPSDISLKRPHSPEAQTVPSPRKISLVKSSTKRKQMFDLDSDIETLDTIIYVPKAPVASKENIPTIHRSTSKPPPSKRRKSSSTRSVHYVPSSQSDEHELVLPRSPQDLATVKESVHKWRKATVDARKMRTPQLYSDADLPTPNDMDIEPASVSPMLDSNVSLPSPNSEHNVIVGNGDWSTVTKSTNFSPNESTSVSRSLVDDYRPLSPPPSDSPVQLHDTDTAQVIAKMKAEALAVTSREEENTFNLPLNLSDLSSDEDDDEDVFGLHKSPKHESLSTQTASSSVISRRSRRLMDLSPSLIDSSSANTCQLFQTTTSHTRNVPNKGPVVLTANLTKKNSTKVNPLAKMLREKQKADTNGYGTKAFLAAEELIASGSGTYDDSDDDLDRLLSMNTLTVGIDPSPELVMDVRNDAPSCVNDLFNGARVEKLLGTKDGQAVGKILNHDRNNRITNTKTVGIEFFDSQSNAVTQASRSGIYISNLDAEDTTDPILTVLKEAVNMKDVAKIEMVLNAGLFGRLKLINLSKCIHWLFDQVFTLYETTLDESAYRVLSITSCSDCHISSMLLSSVLLRLGANRGLLTNVVMKIPADFQHERMNEERRLILKYRWISLVNHFARNGALLDIPNVIVLLLLTALDRSTNSDLKRHVMIAIDGVGQSLPSNTPDFELATCTKVLKLASELSPANQCHLVSLLGGGCPSMARILRWVSLAVLIGEDILPKDHLDHPLPTSRISRLLAAPFDSGEIFDIQNSDKMDYDNLAYHITILGTVLSDVDRQVKYGQGDTAPLELICMQLTALHAKIVDTRAAHLDRSRAKAALQSLSFRIRYQMTTAKSSSKAKGGIEKYFTKKQ